MHSFSMDLSSGRIWDYRKDSYVHRIVSQDYADGDGGGSAIKTNYWEKTEHNDEGTSIEELLQAQLVSQSVQYEETLAELQSQASLSTKREKSLREEISRLEALTQELRSRNVESTSQLNASDQRLAQLNQKIVTLTTLARQLESQYKSEQAMTASLMTRLTHVENARSVAERVANKSKEDLAEAQQTVQVHVVHRSGS